MTYRPSIPKDYKLPIFSASAGRRRLPGWLAPAGLLMLALAGWSLWPAPDSAAQSDAAESQQAAGLTPVAAGSAAAIPAASQFPAQRAAAQTPAPAKTQPAGQLYADPPDTQAAAPILQLDWQTITIQPGDTLASVFAEAGLGPVTVHNVVYTNDHTATLRNLRPGDEIQLALNASGELQAMKFELDEVRLVKVLRRDGDFTTQTIERPLTYKIARASGVIEHSLYAAGLEAGLSDPLILKLARIYAWTIDFVYDIRTGDRFYFIYEKVYRNGEYLRDGKILAATFINRGEPIRAIRYKTRAGAVDYYTPDGTNLRREFLRTPVDFRYISSPFDPNRMHPTLGYVRPHEGVDYAASSGTPVIATGDGVVTRASRWGGYGNCIVINHAGSFETLYAHLSDYARGVRAGARVEQGQIIGYVGMSGTATGPHLHYEFHINGQVRDPLKVEFPPAPPLPETEMARFREHARPLLAKLDEMNDGPTMLAKKKD